VETMLGNGKMLCRSDTRYSESPEFRFVGSAMGPDKAAKDHISSMTPCLASAKKEDLWLKKSQQLQVIGKYDYGTRQGNMENGKQGEVSSATEEASKEETVSDDKQIMAITMLPVEIPREGVPKPW